VIGRSVSDPLLTLIGARSQMPRKELKAIVKGAIEVMAPVKP
jgi:hypothetical protein